MNVDWSAFTPWSASIGGVVIGLAAALLVALGAGYVNAGVFVVAMLLGMGAFELIERMRSESRTPDASGA